MRKIIIPILLAIAVAACSNGTASNWGSDGTGSCSNGSGSCSDGPGSSNDGAGRVASAADFSDAGAEQKTTAVDLGSVVFDAADSLEVEKLLTRSDCRSTLDYARYFLGRPYVAYTLEGAYQEGGDGIEKLVVNLREFDCLTLLETCNALTLARAELDLTRADENLTRAEVASGGDQGSAWAIYCRNLASLRYFGGQIDGYTSRLHYLSMSIDDHLKRGDMLEVQLPDELTLSRTTDIHYMSKHPQYYSALKGNTALQKQIAHLEAQHSGGTFRYLPQDKCGLSRQRLSNIHDGDIIYIVTDKDGLDYAHQGFAFWGQDGKLHMLHASSAKRKVIADPLTLEAYLRGIPSSIGIRVFRLSGIR